ncbi:hypothetical protein B2K_04220 [Paenibacillus mucilaginosus K02]|uniref:Uncharacterized protein n=1 Tax=Paenibacillus mucilaginosus K02 TaxID=997761 RepID=I0BC38_9BACL|nr:hypothetical protein B2K_04220 [Paenibacillus mucilaginosus K02]
MQARNKPMLKMYSFLLMIGIPPQFVMGNTLVFTGAVFAGGCAFLTYRTERQNSVTSSMTWWPS